MKKYDIRFCDCGRIHAIPQETIDKAIENDREVMLVCSHCGRQIVIGADVVDDLDLGRCYSMYTDTVRNYEQMVIETDNSETAAGQFFKLPNRGKMLDSIIFAYGIPVPMQTALYANRHYFGGFVDDRQAGCITEQMTTVDVDRFIMENADKEDILHAISGFHIKGLDWTGTKFNKF